MIIHQIFWKLLITLKHLGQKHDFSIFVSHKNFIIEYFYFKKCQMKEGKIVEGCVIFFHYFLLVNETCHPIWHPLVVKKLHVIYNMDIKCTQSS
jgi:hypothetical protein